MGTRRNSRRKAEWALWLAAGLAIWLAGAFLITAYLDGSSGAAGRPECIASCVYLGVLLAVMAVGNFARVRTLLAMEMLYGVAVLFRAVIGTLTALLFIEQPIAEKWGGFFDTMVRPLSGLEYVAAQLTSHFITEIYWLGLGLSATILVFWRALHLWRLAAGSAVNASGSSAGGRLCRQKRMRPPKPRQKCANETQHRPQPAIRICRRVKSGGYFRGIVFVAQQ